METQNNIYKNLPDGETELPLQEPVTNDQREKIDERKYRYLEAKHKRELGLKYFKVGIFSFLILVIALCGSRKMLEVGAATGSGFALIKKVVQMIKIRSSDKPRSP